MLGKAYLEINENKVCYGLQDVMENGDYLDEEDR